MDYGFSSTMRPEDERQPHWARQREERGFDDTELWALDSALSQMIVVRLKAFKDGHICHPPCITMEEWDGIIQKMIDGFEEVLTRDLTTEKRGREWDGEKVQEGLKLFAEYFCDLWS